ncbi:MAG TPA: hypothetical protein VGB85_34075 [Nannocystis sp.]|jgi:hypothetical protein
MRLSPLLLVLAVACADREVPADDSTAEDTTADVGTTGPTSDPTGPVTDASTGPTTGELDNPSGFCSPAQDPGACPADYICCSDDPATTKARLPNYFNGKNDDKYGVPIFSGANNALSFSGQCVDVGEFPSPFEGGCPVPCDPTWDPADRDALCGVGALCCPFRQVDPIKDCVLDPVTNKWRAVHGTDIGKLTTWGPAHTTNQDPTGASCLSFAGGAMPDKAVLADCYEQLTVADRRGFCYKTCPCYEDLCDQKNPGYVPRCGGP